MLTKSFKNYTAKWNPHEVVPCNGSYEEFPVSFFKDNQLIYTLTFEIYSRFNSNFVMIEWFELAGHTIHIFNRDMNALAIVDANTGEILREVDLDCFTIRDYKIFEGEYIYMEGIFIYDAWAMCALLRISDLFQDGCRCILNTCKWSDTKFDICGCASVEEFANTHQAIFRGYTVQQETKMFNERRTNNNLMRKLMADPAIYFQGDSRRKLSTIFDMHQTVLDFRVIGNSSGDILDSNLFLRGFCNKISDEMTSYKDIFYFSVYGCSMENRSDWSVNFRVEIACPEKLEIRVKTQYTQTPDEIFSVQVIETGEEERDLPIDLNTPFTK